MLGIASSKLDKIVAKTARFQDIELMVIGYTDNVGTTQHNNVLYLGRANAVKAYLVTKGDAEERIGVSGKSALNPIAEKDTDEGCEKTGGWRSITRYLWNRLNQQH